MAAALTEAAGPSAAGAGAGSAALARELAALLLRGPRSGGQGGGAWPRLTLAVAESLTSGHVQAAIGAVSGASQFFLGGITAYSGAQKVAHLGVSRSEGEAVNWVSAVVAEQMARGACELFGASVALATTGYAEAAPEQGVQAPYAWWALAQRVAAQQAGAPAGLATGAAAARAAFRVHSARVDFVAAMPRVAVQEAVTAAALAGLCAQLRASGAAGLL